jgi:translocator protein
VFAPRNSYQEQQHLHGLVKTSTTLAASSASSDDATSKKFDFDAVVKYAAAIAIQMSLLLGLFSGLDAIVSRFSLQVPFAVNVAFFYALALKSRVFNPLANNRPKVQTLETAKEQEKRKMPTWTPPGVVFPIMWLLIIAPLRAVASSMIYASTKCYANTAILTLMLHLSIGDVWNTINNVEKRYGVSVVGVLCVWLSKAYAAYQYYQIVPLAGKLLALPLIWLSIASSLIAATWRLNPDPNTGKPEPLFPTVGDKKTKLVWFSKQ